MDLKLTREMEERRSTRRNLVKGADRSQKIRTYNFSQVVIHYSTVIRNIYPIYRKGWLTTALGSPWRTWHPCLKVTISKLSSTLSCGIMQSLLWKRCWKGLIEINQLRKLHVLEVLTNRCKTIPGENMSWTEWHEMNASISIETIKSCPNAYQRASRCNILVQWTYWCSKLPQTVSRLFSTIARLPQFTCDGYFACKFP